MTKSDLRRAAGSLIKRHGICSLLLVFLFLASIADATDAPQAATGNPVSEIRVLFIGNSFTYFHNMPAVLEAISSSIRGPRVVATMVVSGGARLKDHWRDAGPALSAIRKGRWDYVVLQEQSLLGNVVVVNQHMQIVDPVDFWKYAKLFDEEIRKVGAKTVILMTWKDKTDEARSQQALDFAFVKFARSSGAIAAPVSLAWQRIRDNAPGINLYLKDDHHPSAEGSYLEACVLYATLTGQSPDGAISMISGTAVDEDEGNMLEGKTETLVEIPHEIAKELQQTAWNTYQEVRAAGGYQAVSEPPAIVLPTMPNGRRPSPAELEGVWKGPFHFFPSDAPIEIELRVSNKGSGLAAKLHVYYHGAKPDVEVTPSAFHVTDYGIAFTDPKGPNKGTIEFSGAFTSASLAGVAKTLLRNTDPPISVWGTWNLTKVK
jgi:hypothetical protein